MSFVTVNGLMRVPLGGHYPLDQPLPVRLYHAVKWADRRDDTYYYITAENYALSRDAVTQHQKRIRGRKSKPGEQLVQQQVSDVVPEYYTQRVAICNQCGSKDSSCYLWKGLSPCNRRKHLLDADAQCPANEPKWGKVFRFQPPPNAAAICRTCADQKGCPRICATCGNTEVIITGPCPRNRWTPQPSGLKTKAVALVVDHTIRQLGGALVEACYRSGVDLELALIDETYWRRVERERNIMTWGVRQPTSRYKRPGKNPLFIDNGLLAQWSGAYLDDGGWYSDSTLVNDRPTPTEEELNQLSRFVRRHFGWGLFQGGNPDGPVLYAVQNEADSSQTLQFPAMNRTLGPTVSGLKMLSEMQLDRPVLVRPHPRHLDIWPDLKIKAEPYWQESWTEDYSRNVYRTLAGCSMLVTVNSTLANEAMSLGIPVVMFGVGTFSGVDQRDQQDVAAHLCSILRSYHVRYGATAEEITRLPCFIRWVGRCLELHD